MIIPWQEISPETLKNLLESIVLREGTDYGEYEQLLGIKVNEIYQQLKEGDVFLVWSELHESINVMPKQTFKTHTNDE